jgi:hypothetical protein
MVKTTTSKRNGVILSVTIDEEYYEGVPLEEIKSMRNGGVPVFFYRVRWEDCSEGDLKSEGHFARVDVGDSFEVDVTEGSAGRHYGWPYKVRA